jgi:hypothetical protein
VRVPAEPGASAEPAARGGIAAEIQGFRDCAEACLVDKIGVNLVTIDKNVDIRICSARISRSDGHLRNPVNAGETPGRPDDTVRLKTFLLIVEKIDTETSRLSQCVRC